MSMSVQITCPQCQSSIEVYPSVDAQSAECNICQHQVELHFKKEHEEGLLKDCPVCKRKDFYKQKDFNRKVGVILFVIAACFVPWTYGLSLLALYLLDVFLFRKLRLVAVCYKCSTIFRGVQNLEGIGEFNHEMNDRIVYSDHDFEGKPLSH